MMCFAEVTIIGSLMRSVICEGKTHKDIVSWYVEKHESAP